MNHMEVMKLLATDSSLTLTQIRVLLAILSFSKKQKKEIARSYLSNLLNISPHNISRTTTILVAKGYLKKTKLNGVTNYEWVSGETRYQERHGICGDTLNKSKVSQVIPKDTIYNNYTVYSIDNKGGYGGEIDPIPYGEIIKDLNQTTKKTFLSSAKKTRELIKARWNEGFRLENFIHVHKVKNEEWGTNLEMNKFLRPETLYSNKFHSYVNEKLKEDIQKSAEEEKMNSPETQDAIDYLKVLTGNTKQLN